MNLDGRAATVDDNPPGEISWVIDTGEMWNDDDDDHPAILEQNNGKSTIQLLMYAAVTTICLVLTVASKGSSLIIKNDNYNLYQRQYPLIKEEVTDDIDEVGVGSPVLPVTKTKEGGEQSTTNKSDLQLPRILLAGVQKSGSTAVADFLHRAGVCLSRPNPAQDIEQKSVYYFDKNYDRGIDYYASMFAHCEYKEGVGEKVGMDLATDATPNNFRMAHRIRQTYDQVSSDQLEKLKIIVVVREPVARELSWYNHLVSECIKHPNEQCKKKISNRDRKTSKKHKKKRGGTDPTKNIKSFPEYAEYLFGDFMDGKPQMEKYLPSSFYERYLAEWYEMFNPKQILFLNYSELKQDERNFLKRIASFLELDVDDSLMDGGTSTKNTQQKGGMKVSTAPCDLQQRLAAAFEEYNEKFYKMLDEADGPRHQQKPFPRFEFELSNCTDTVAHSSLESDQGSVVTSQVNKPNNTLNDVHLPRILLAGVQKSGSTALSDFVHRAGACLSRPNPSKEKEEKEVHFFDNNNYMKGIDYYSKLFAHCKNMSVAVDATPETFLFPHRVKEVYDLAGKRTLEELKIIIVVREPVARVLSLYNHLADACSGDDLKKCWEREQMIKSHNESSGQLRTFPEYAHHQFGDYIIDHLPTYKKEWLTGWYGEKFENWFHHFDRKQILVLSYSELKQDESSFLKRVVSFLNLDVDPTMIQSGTKIANAHNIPRKIKLPPCDVQDRMAKMFMPSNDKFFMMMNHGEEGPPMEQRPFPRFVLSNCTTNKEYES